MSFVLLRILIILSMTSVVDVVRHRCASSTIVVIYIVSKGACGNRGRYTGLASC